jgi:alpha-glucosidase
VPNWDRLATYLAPDQYHQAFDFEFLLSAWDPDALRSAIATSLEGAAKVGSVPTWVLSNHDVVRHATRYGLPSGVTARDWLLDGDRSLIDRKLGLRRARAATLLMLALPGSVYLYQGEELGLHEVYDLPLDVLDDPVWKRSRHTEKGRDGCRVPIPWTVGGRSAGFGSNGSWLPQPDGWAAQSVEAQEGVEDSTLELYRNALSVRKTHLVDDEVLEWHDPGGPDVIAFRRGSGLTCVVNLGSVDFELPAGEIVISSESLSGTNLPPDTAVWMR